MNPAAAQVDVSITTTAGVSITAHFPRDLIASWPPDRYEQLMILAGGISDLAMSPEFNQPETYLQPLPAAAPAPVPVPVARLEPSDAGQHMADLLVAIGTYPGHQVTDPDGFVPRLLAPLLGWKQPGVYSMLLNAKDHGYVTLDEAGTKIITAALTPAGEAAAAARTREDTADA